MIKLTTVESKGGYRLPLRLSDNALAVTAAPVMLLDTLFPGDAAGEGVGEGVLFASPVNTKVLPSPATMGHLR